MNALIFTLLLGQTFDVAIIKPSPPNIRGADFAALRNGTVPAQNVTLPMLLEEAFHRHASRIEGPKWITTNRFDVNTKAEGNPSQQQTAEML